MKTFFQKVLSEFFGTFFLVLFIVWAVVEPGDVTTIAIAGGTLLAIWVAAFGSVSAHLNPAVTVAMTIFRKTSMIEATMFIPTQIAGAYAAVRVIGRFFGESAKAVKLGAPEPCQNCTDSGAFFTEALFTFVLVLAVRATADSKNYPLAGALIGVALGVGIKLAGPLSGGALNPARSLAPLWQEGMVRADILSLSFSPERLWQIYVVGPLAGSLAACAVWSLVYLFNSGTND